MNGNTLATTRQQLVRFAIIGLGTNLGLYLAYLAFTAWGLGHKMAMSLMFGIGVTFSFAFNRNWTFSHKGILSHSLLAYLALYASGYLINLAALYVLVDNLGYDHRMIQLIMVATLAAYFFIAQKFYVFRNK